MRSCMVAGKPTHLVQELNVGTEPNMTGVLCNGFSKGNVPLGVRIDLFIDIEVL